MPKQFIITFLMSALASFPGGERVKRGLDALLHRDSDSTNDINEVANAVGEVAVGALFVFEGVSSKDVVNNAELESLVSEVKAVIARIQKVIVKHAA
jgi:hypothetical protein